MLIFAVAVASAIGLTLLTTTLVGALCGLVLAIVGSWYGIRWTREWWRNAKRPQDWHTIGTFCALARAFTG